MIFLRNRSGAARLACVGAAVVIGVAVAGSGPAAPIVPGPAIDSGALAPTRASITPPPAGVVAAVRPTVPVRLTIPVLGVDAPVVPVTDTAGALDVPADPHVVGWWQEGGPPGVDGAAGLLDGHVDTAAQGPGALFHLAALRPGDGISVLTATGTVQHYAVTAIHSYRKVDLPPDALGATGDPQLVLVTCGGRFDQQTRSYVDNVVVRAQLLF